MHLSYIFSHKMKYMISISLLITTFAIGLSGCTNQTAENSSIQTEQSKLTQSIVNQYTAALSDAELKEDFDAFMNLFEENYPFLEVNARLSGVNFMANRQVYWEQVKDCKTSLDLSRKLSHILEDLHNGHTHIVKKGEMFQSYYQVYSDIASQAGGERYQPWVDTFEMPNTIGFYNPKPLADSKKMPAADRPVDKNNLDMKALADGRAFYINIKSFNYYNLEYDKPILYQALTTHKDAKALILDLRENSGGSTDYWEKLIVPALIDKPFTTKYVTLFKNGDNNKRYLDAIFNGSNKKYLKKTSDLYTKDFPEAKPEVFSVFSHYTENNLEIQPHDSVGFKGKVYLLVGPKVYSASEAFASFAKESGFASLIGKKTGGDGLGTDPVFFSLPNSGIVIRYSLDYGMLQNGSANEEFHTLPDYFIEGTATKNLSTDPCIVKALELEGLVQ